MKNIKTICLLLVTTLFFACNNNKPEDTKEVAEDKNDERFENRKAEKDADFLAEAAGISLEEIALGELAASKATNTEVKDLGSMMVTEHQKSLEELKALAAKKSVALPEAMTDNAKEDLGKFSNKEAKEFDKDYCDKMVDGHKDAISKFEKASTDAEDADVRNWATQTLPTLRKHLDHAMACREKCEKDKKK